MHVCSFAAFFVFGTLESLYLGILDSNNLIARVRSQRGAQCGLTSANQDNRIQKEQCLVSRGKYGLLVSLSLLLIKY